MPIKIPNSLPATTILDSENIFVMTEYRAINQCIRPLKLVMLNLMPTKVTTETQLLRLLSNSPLQVEVDLMQMSSHVSKNTPQDHLLSFYKTFGELRLKKYDGMIVTGAPVELLDYEQVDYWKELTEIFEWSKTNVYSTMYVCWGAQAGLYYHYGIPKYTLDEKMFGVFQHETIPSKWRLTRGFDNRFFAPHSRRTEVREEDILREPSLRILAKSPEAGVYLICKENGRQIYVMGHCEYDQDTLAKEYFRDVGKGLNPHVPKNYFPNDDPNLPPHNYWRSHANLLFSNWLNYYVYQTTPYNLEEIDTQYQTNNFTV